MREKRVVVVFFILVLLYSFLIVKLVMLSQPNSTINQAAQTHGSYIVKFSSTRGTIYDSSLNKLVNVKEQYVAAVAPVENTTAQFIALSPFVDNIQILTQKLSQRIPFSLNISSPDISAESTDVLKTYVRYEDKAVSPALIGYLDSSGNGTAGIEKAFDTQLKTYSKAVTAAFPVDATGRLLKGLSVEIRVEGLGDMGGVVLTLDKDIQQAAEQAANKFLKAGSVIVMDSKTGDILASVSSPTFSPNDLAAAMKGVNSPMTNHVFSAYNLGSIFKIAVTAAALESGISPDFQVTCTGSIDVSGQLFHCHYLPGHGKEDMSLGFENSCNPYYITLGQKTGADNILSMAKKLGFGQPSDFAPGLTSVAGSLPDAVTLKLPAALANFSMGQGEFLATPVQVARMVAAVANNGLLPTPRLVTGIVDNDLKFLKTYPGAVPDSVFSEKTADLIRQFMIKTVNEGTGKPAKPLYGGAGGKTSTAETGWVQNGKTINQAWFAGFYPAEQPKYVIVAMCENGVAGGADAGPVFKYIANALAPRCGFPVVQQ